MLNKAEAVSLLVEEKLPLFTREISAALSKIKPGPPHPSPDAVLELVKLYPDHFADLLFDKTSGHQLRGSVVWTNPETGNEFDDLHIDIICRYLRIAYKMEDHLYYAIPHDHFFKKYERSSPGRRVRLLESGRRQDAQRFFMLPDAIASEDCLRHWRELPYLTSDECAALAMGCDPKIVSLEKVENAVGNGQSAFLERYRKLKHTFESYQSSKSSHSKISAAQYRKLMKEPAIKPNILPNSNQPKRQSNDAETQEVSLPAVHSLYKIVIAIAIMQYPGIVEYFEEEDRTGFVRRDPAGSVFTHMEKDLRPIIPSLNTKNIRDYVRRAYNYAKNKRLLPEDERERFEKILEK